jgi:hypothetical protein
VSGLRGEGEVDEAPGGVGEVWCGQRRARGEEGRTTVNGARLPANNGRGGGVDTEDHVLSLTGDGEAMELAGGEVGSWRLNGARWQGALGEEKPKWRRGWMRC